MEPRNILICRLCFEVCETNFEIIKDTIKGILNFLQLKLNVDISDEPVICSNCMDNLTACFNFKIDCLHKMGDTSIEDGDIKLNVPNVYSMENLAFAFDVLHNNCKCCSCMQLVNCATSVLLMNEEKSVTTMLEKYFPELIANGAVNFMCIACYKSLQNQLAFIRNCVIIEEGIKRYCKSEGTNSKGQVQLISMLRFVSENQMENNIHNSLEKKHLVVVEEPEMRCIKGEDIDRKMEQVDGDRPDAFQTMHKSRLASSPRLHQSTKKRSTKGTMTESMCPTAQKDNLLYHNNLSKRKVFKCKICTFETKYKSCIQRHVLIHKDPSESKTFKCKICPFRAIRKDHLKQHIRSHKCPPCGNRV